ncbi:MAG: 23S rRNA (adenine(2503)-C(2))-methyltransferase RlmN [Candidatus Uhrbacteria bacterium]
MTATEQQNDSVPITRADCIHSSMPDAPSYRLEQVDRALYDPAIRGWSQISTLPKAMREVLDAGVPWMSVREVRCLESSSGDTWKAILETNDALRFETVLMQNRRGQWTICVSSQIGCAMRCAFCATGTMGLKRSLTEDEIADQYRYWLYFLHDHPKDGDERTRISNVVFMGMGEPLANYEHVKCAIATWLRMTDIGPTRITVSTVGVLPQMEKLLTDPEWPNVRIAISLHSANEEQRKAIIPTTVPNFLERLADWSRRYDVQLGNRRHYVTYEYLLLNGVNDMPKHARGLATYLRHTGSRKVNVIPWNSVSGKAFSQSEHNRVVAFKQILLDAGIDVTQRRTMGEDIAAACGQLVVDGTGDE